MRTKIESLTKRARDAKKILNCSNSFAWAIAKAYGGYLDGVEVNAPCKPFKEWIKKFN